MPARRLLLATVVGLMVVGAACGAGVPVRSTGPSSTTLDQAAGPASEAVPSTVVPSTVVPPPPPPALAEGPAPTLHVPADPLPDGEDAVVEEVVDGDTIVVSGGTRVRLIGVDTPETKDPRKPVQCFGREAAAHTASLIGPGTAVRLAFDVERRDRYDRTLAYVYRADDGLFVNAALVAGGYAQVATYPPNVAHTDELLALSRVAREEGRGLWSACREDPAAEAIPPAPPPPSPSPDGACGPSYPGVCIPPAPPDLDCGDISERRFQVVAPDPHRFDGDRDSIGCES